MEMILATPRQGILALATEDLYLTQLKNWEFSAKTDGGVKTLEAFRTHVSKQVLKWSDAEAKHLKRIFENVEKRLAETVDKSILDKDIYVVKTTGLDEWKSAYTRENCIIIPENKLDYDDISLEKLLVHEVFHILSRRSPVFRETLYQTLGFEKIDFDRSMHPVFDLQLINPDALDTGWALRDDTKAHLEWVYPIIFLKDGRLSFEAGDIFERIAFELYVFNEDKTSGRIVAVQDVDVFRHPFGTFGFMAHHPEELLAEAFVDHLYKGSRFAGTGWYEKCCPIFSSGHVLRDL